MFPELDGGLDAIREPAPPGAIAEAVQGGEKGGGDGDGEGESGGGDVVAAGEAMGKLGLD